MKAARWKFHLAVVLLLVALVGGAVFLYGHYYSLAKEIDEQIKKTNYLEAATLVQTAALPVVPQWSRDNGAGSLYLLSYLADLGSDQHLAKVAETEGDRVCPGGASAACANLEATCTILDSRLKLDSLAEACARTSARSARRRCAGKDLEATLVLARALNNLGEIYRAHAKPSLAEQAQSESIELAEAVLARVKILQAEQTSLPRGIDGQARNILSQALQSQMSLFRQLERKEEIEPLTLRLKELNGRL
ncbi:MAG: hypothetical protein K2Y32_12805 [Candidatus Obscuribacterales bacterium]|nr:hypothetical protein [Candidatus Obscuribacterales bacterium]